MKTITATEFKNRAAQVLKEVSSSGKTIIVTKRGKPLVRVEAVSEKRGPIKLGTMADTLIVMGDIVSPVFDEWEYLDPNENPRHRR